MLPLQLKATARSRISVNFNSVLLVLFKTIIYTLSSK